MVLIAFNTVINVIIQVCQLLMTEQWSAYHPYLYFVYCAFAVFEPSTKISHVASCMHLIFHMIQIILSQASSVSMSSRKYLRVERVKSSWHAWGEFTLHNVSRVSSPCLDTIKHSVLVVDYDNGTRRLYKLLERLRRR